MAARIEIKGQASLKAKLQRMVTGVQGHELEDSVVAGAVPVMEAAKRYAPKHEDALTHSIHIGGHEELAGDYDGNYPRGTATVPAPDVAPNTVSVYVGTDIVYGAQKEYGGTITAKNAPRLVWQDYSGNWHSAVSVYQNPQPYLRPALDESSSNRNWVTTIGQQLLRRIRRAVGV